MRIGDSGLLIGKGEVKMQFLATPIPAGFGWACLCAPARPEMLEFFEEIE